LQAEIKPSPVVPDKKESKSKPPLPPLERTLSIDKFPKGLEKSISQEPKEVQNSTQSLFTKPGEDSVREGN